ncbi:hypothetical protein ACIPJG_33845 [Streptomyces halstedii]|uniref:hypothetical protein n=1 Tax=Streptomyces TaxID=1883 RepID=UPI00081F0D35|nr:hypothetical protein [Streptomyces sp. PpalLS-921]SCD61169.1 hypothetical protein GA0115249_106313 [Streptomyces sp. PpalLS-921]
MPILAGQIITAGQLARMQPTPYIGEATAALTAGTTYQLIPGCSITLATLAPNASYSVIGVFDSAVTTVHATNLMVGRLVVDGAAGTGLAIHAMDTLDQDTVAMVWNGTLPAAGSHTFRLEGVISGTGGAGRFGQYTRLLVTITEVV